MIRITTLAALALVFAGNAHAQIIIRGRPALPPPVPAGLGQKPVLPLPGSPLQHTTALPRPTALRTFLGANPYYNLGGYIPYWPGYYETAPTVINNYIPVPTPAPATPTLPAPKPELRAHLTLNVPPGAKVWLAGNEIDAAVAPLILDSPILKEGQSYTFDIKVTWVEGRTTEERTRKVAVDAGESKSLTYIAAR
jgi:uncharacterized protein (TIGR03000 family)